MSRFFAIITFLLSFSYSLHSEQILIKNGDIFSGKIIRMYDDYALVTSYLGDFRIPVKYIFSIKNVEGLPVLVTLNTGESFQYTFKSADSNVLVFQSGERTLSFPWETVKDCIFLDP